MKNKKKWVILLGVTFCVFVVTWILINPKQKELETLMNSTKEHTSNSITEQVTKKVYLSEEKKISLDIPTSWEYEKKTAQGEEEFYLYPEQEAKERYVLIRISQEFFICGTGLVTKVMDSNEKEKMTVGYYHTEEEPWDFVTIPYEDSKIIFSNMGLTKNESNLAIEMIKTIQW